MKMKVFFLLLLVLFFNSCSSEREREIRKFENSNYQPTQQELDSIFK